ncbi:MAG: N-acetylmannosamine-6-phosphate 2-epimerase [Rubrivivax sp.]
MRPRQGVGEVDAALRGGLVVSCQPVEGGPLDDDEVVCRLAQAAVAGGAAGLRVAGAERVARVRDAVAVPVIGIVKRDLDTSPVRITPLLEDVRALLAAGADVVAVDATARVRPVAVTVLLAAIREGGAVSMADASCLEDGLAAQALGFDIVGSTMSGYTGGPVPTQPDLELVRVLARHGARVMAEGRFNTPAQAAQAVAAGAWAVTVGSALTRLEHATRWFRDALAHPPVG